MSSQTFSLVRGRRDSTRSAQRGASNSRREANKPLQILQGDEQGRKKADLGIAKARRSLCFGSAEQERSWVSPTNVSTSDIHSGTALQAPWPPKTLLCLSGLGPPQKIPHFKVSTFFLHFWSILNFPPCHRKGFKRSRRRSNRRCLPS